ncbi:MAG: CPBP family intramembrane metalloprotease, partial [Clostridia bacterium]|nr:CPBP family intramembrane metalloprotease [Clostridia bacterium]
AFTPMTVLTSALSPAIGEEMLFRYTCLALLLPYGKRFGVAVSALLFALFHQNFYQMPYALAAGIVLALAALYSRSFLLPIFLHFANNLLSLFMGDRLTLPLVFLFVGLGIASGITLFFLSRKKEEAPSLQAPLSFLSLLPLLAYAVYCIFIAALRL